MSNSFSRSCILVGAFALAATLTSAQIYLNFGSDIVDLDKTWNVSTGTDSISDLLDSSGYGTGVSMSWIAGLENPSAVKGIDLAIDDFVAQANYSNINSSQATPREMQISGLDSSLTYNFTFFAHRGGATDDKSAIYTFTGSTTDSVVVNANSFNTTLNTLSIQPDVSGNVLFTIEKTGANSLFVYLNAMKISAAGGLAVIPEPASVSMLLGLLALGGFALNRRRLN